MRVPILNTGLSLSVGPFAVYARLTPFVWRWSFGASDWSAILQLGPLEVEMYRWTEATEDTD